MVRGVDRFNRCDERRGKVLVARGVDRFNRCGERRGLTEKGVAWGVHI